ncbi:MAG: hypothetical protein E7057_03285 [Lentisphaerae bacterium]|nr:hypothetical protein [Lentisphaerota bacterium]
MNELKNSYRKFLIVCDDLGLKICRGEIENGKPFMNRAEICEIYGISPVTAHRVQKELCKRGLLIARKGRPFLVASPNSKSAALKELVFVRQVPTFEIGYHSDAVFEGIRQVAKENNIPCREIYLELLDKNSKKLNVCCDCDPDSGLIFMPYNSILVRGAGYFFKPGFNRATVMFQLSGVPGTKTDDFDGVEKLLSEAKTRGAKSVMFVPGCIGSSRDPVLDGEKLLYGKLLCSKLGLQFMQSISGIVPLIKKDIANMRPDAVVFHSPSMICNGNWKLFIPDDREYMPQILTFTLACEPDADYGCEVICYESDPVVHGRAAAEILLSGQGRVYHGLIEYIKGKLSYFNS